MSDTATQPAPPQQQPIAPNSMTPASQAPPQVPQQQQQRPPDPQKPQQPEAVDYWDPNEELELDNGQRVTIGELVQKAQERDQLAQRYEADSKRPAAERIVELMKQAGNDPNQQMALKEMLAQTLQQEVQAARQPKPDPASMPSDEVIQLKAQLMAHQQLFNEIIPDIETKKVNQVGEYIKGEISPVAEKLPRLAHAMKSPEALSAISRHLIDYSKKFQQANGGKNMTATDRARWAMQYEGYLKSVNAPDGSQQAPPQGQTMFTSSMQGMDAPPDRIPNPVRPGEVVFEQFNSLGAGNNLPDPNRPVNQAVQGRFDNNVNFVPNQVPSSMGAGPGGQGPQPQPRVTGPQALRQSVADGIRRMFADGAGAA